MIKCDHQTKTFGSTKRSGKSPPAPSERYVRPSAVPVICPDCQRRVTSRTTACSNLCRAPAQTHAHSYRPPRPGIRCATGRPASCAMWLPVATALHARWPLLFKFRSTSAAAHCGRQQQQHGLGPRATSPPIPTTRISTPAMQWSPPQIPGRQHATVPKNRTRTCLHIFLCCFLSWIVTVNH